MTRWARADSTLFRRTTTAVVLLPAGAVEPIELRGAAALVWDVLEEPTTTTDAIELLARACGEGVERIGPDVTALLRHLEELGAAVETEPAAC